MWVADRAGTSLFPILAEGYAPHVLARMGSIGRDADNAAAAAYRQGELRTVPAHDSLPGAIVAPIITGDGCVGVLAAEMRHGTERDEATQAITAILAAQLATFVTAVPAQETKQESLGSGSASTRLLAPGLALCCALCIVHCALPRELPSQIGSALRFRSRRSSLAVAVALFLSRM